MCNFWAPGYQGQAIFPYFASLHHSDLLVCSILNYRDIKNTFPPKPPGNFFLILLWLSVLTTQIKMSIQRGEPCQPPRPPILLLLRTSKSKNIILTIRPRISSAKTSSRADWRILNLTIWQKNDENNWRHFRRTFEWKPADVSQAAQEIQLFICGPWMSLAVNY